MGARYHQKKSGIKQTTRPPPVAHADLPPSKTRPPRELTVAVFCHGHQPARTSTRHWHRTPERPPLRRRGFHIHHPFQSRSRGREGGGGASAGHGVAGDASQDSAELAIAARLEYHRQTVAVRADTADENSANPSWATTRQSSA